MPTQRNTEPPRSPAPGVIPEPVRVEQDPRADHAPVRSDPRSERDARRHAREEARGPNAERPGVRTPDRRRRLPLEGPLMRIVASAVIVGIAVAIAALMGSWGSQAWLIGLVVSVVSLLLATVLWSPRRP